MKTPQEELQEYDEFITKKMLIVNQSLEIITEAAKDIQEALKNL